MEKFGAFVGVSLALVLLIVLAAGWANGRAAEANRTEALVVRAQGQAALDRAQAAATQLGAVAGVIGATGAVVVGAAAAVVGLLLLAGLIVHTTATVATAAVTGVVAIAQQRQPPQIIERRVVYLPRPEQSRREVWRQLSGGQVDLLPAPDKEKQR